VFFLKLISEQFENQTINTTLSEQFENQTINTTLSEQFENAIEIALKEAKTIPCKSFLDSVVNVSHNF
jgi:hypothetical protein